ncbi:MAG: hypothetical protein R2771_03215 [Saprospiraceae bacterium]
MFEKISFNLNLASKFSLSIFLLFLTHYISNAQFNTEIGYTLSYVKSDNINKIIDDYNGSTEMLTNMENLKYINGFNAGVSYRMGMIKLGAFWKSQTAYKYGIEGTLLSEDNVEKKLYFYYNSIGLGGDFIYDYFGVGTDINYNIFKIKTKKSNLDNKIDVISDNYFSSEFHLIFNFKISKSIGFQIKPYVGIPWNKVDITPVVDYLEYDDNPSKIESDFVFYGVSFVLMNGKQK